MDKTMAYVLNSNVLRYGNGNYANASSASPVTVDAVSGIGVAGRCINGNARCGFCPVSGDLYDFMCELRLLKNRRVILHVCDADIEAILLDIACDAVRVLDAETGNITVIRLDKIVYFEEPTTTIL